MFKLAKIIIGLGVIFSIPVFSSATIIHVPSEQPTIQAGIDAAIEGDTVLVADGTYTGEGNQNIDFNGKNIHLKSENGPGVTIIDCQLEGRGFSFHSGENSSSVLDGFTITGGMSLSGAGISISNSGPTIKNNRIVGNIDGTGSIWSPTQYGSGAGISIGNNSSPLIDNNIISNNYLSWYGTGTAICCNNSSPIITNNIINDNSQSCYSWCGALYFSNSHVILENNTISNNFSWYDGPIVFSTSEVNLINNIIKDNFNLSWGGAITCEESNVDIKNCVILGNITSYSGINCVWEDMPSGWREDEDFSYMEWMKVYLDTMSVTEESNYDNPPETGAIFSNASIVSLTNSIICANTPPQIDFTEGEPVNVNYCLVNGGYEGVGNIDTDPLFIDPRNGNFNVCSESPCIDAGDPSIQDPDNSISDIGLYYPDHPQCNNGTVWYVATTGSDEFGDGTAGNPFRTIQHGIDMAHSLDTVIVERGVYSENIILYYKNIALTSNFIFTKDSADILETVIRSDTEEPAVYLNINLFSCSVTGFKITSSILPAEGYYGPAIYGENSYGLIKHNYISGFPFAGIEAWYNSNLIIDSNIITENHTGIRLGKASGNINDNIISNHDYAGLDIYRADPIIEGNYITNNNVGIREDIGAASSIINNVIDKSINYGIRVSFFSDPFIKGNTITQNRMGIILMGNDCPLIENCIIAFNPWFGIDCPDPSPLNHVKKCNIYGNGNDQQDCVLELIGIDGNISEDPLFCDLINGDYHISADSKCAPPNNNSGELIGALGVGCIAGHASWHVSVAGDDITGDGSFDHPYATIQHGIDVAADGDLVLVHEGTYIGDGNRDINFNGKNVYLKSYNGPNLTIIDCDNTDNNHYGITLENGENADAVIDGFTIRESQVAVRCFGTSPTIKGNIIIDNGQNGALGGGLYCSNGSPTIIDNIVSNNTVTNSEGFWEWGAIGTINAGPDIIGNTISDNTGTGICCVNSEAYIGDNRIINNYVQEGAAGGIYINGGHSIIENNEIIDNYSYISIGTCGGGIFINGEATVISNLIVNNISYMGGGITCLNGNPHLTNNTISTNQGGGIYLKNASPIIENCILAFNTVNEAVECYSVDCHPEIICSDIYGNEGGDWTGCITDQAGINGNLFANPLFCNMETDDYNIAQVSPCAPANNSCDVLIGTRGIGCTYAFICGDTDGDGDISALDIVLLVDYYFNGGSLPTKKYNADINCDYSISLADIVYLCDYLYHFGPADCCQ